MCNKILEIKEGNSNVKLSQMSLKNISFHQCFIFELLI